MLTVEQMKRLKKVNVSKDAAQSAQRLKEDFSSATKEQKTLITELSGLKRNSFYNAYSRGSVTAKVALAMAQVLNISPFYYTGEKDEKEPLQDDAILSFLKGLGYDNLVTELSGTPSSTRSKRKYDRKKKVKSGEIKQAEPATPGADQHPEPLSDNQDLFQEPITPEAEQHAEAFEQRATETVDTLSLSDSPEMQSAIEELGIDDAIILLRSLYLRGKAGGQAGQLAELVKRCLLS